MLISAQFDMDKNFIDNMVTKKDFFMERIFDIEVTKRDEPTYICLQLRLDDSRGNVVTRDYPISGFPRRFMVEKERNGNIPILLTAICNTLLTFISQPRDFRGVRQRSTAARLPAL